MERNAADGILSQASNHEAMAEFVLRQPLSTSDLNCLLEFLVPNPNPNPNLKRAFLLRSILNDLPIITLETINNIERIQLLHNPNSSIDPDLLRKAFLHAAIAATLIELHYGKIKEYKRLVQNLWVDRMSDIARNPPMKIALLCDEIEEWRTKMVRGDMKISDVSSDYRGRLLGEWSSARGVQAVKNYLKAEFHAMKPLPLMEGMDVDMAPEEIPTAAIQKNSSVLRKKLG